MFSRFSLDPRSLCKRAGLLLMSGSLVLSAAFACAQPVDRAAIARVIAQAAAPLVPRPLVPTPVPEASTLPSPSPNPPVAAASPAKLRSPLTLSLTGSLNAGTRLNHSERTSTGSTDESAGMNAEISRRTAMTSLRLDVPVGVSNRQSTLGDARAEYNTPHFGLVYEGQTLSPIAQLILGTTLRGFGLVMPVRGGQLTAFEGVNIADDNRLFRLLGLQAIIPVRGSVQTIGLYHANAAQGGQIDTLDLGFSTPASSLFDLSLEAALQNTRGMNLSPNGHSLSVGMRSDFGRANTYGTLTLRAINQGFIALGSSVQRPDRFAGLTLRKESGRTSLIFEQAFDRASDVDGTSELQRRSLTLSSAVSRRMNSTLFLSEQRALTANDRQWIGNASAAIGYAGDQFGLAVSGLLQRSTQRSGVPSSASSFGLDLTHSFGSLLGTVSYDSQRQHALAGRNANDALRLQFGRTFGRTAIAFNQNFTKIAAVGTQATQTASIFNISRRISPVITLTLQAGVQRTIDRLNPLSNDRGYILNLNVGAPFAFGSGVVTGRADPNLPGSIIGIVSSDANDSLSSYVPSGIPNIIVLLDGVTPQRTDLRGRFEFRFLKPGSHEISIDPASVPRGFTVSQPLANVMLQGGQTAQVNLAIGPYGAIAGTIGSHSSAGFTPIANAAFVVDHATTIHSSASGRFGIGRLLPGEHTIEVSQQSLPANVTLDGELVRKLIVRSGEVSQLDFLSAPLGSIEGKVVLAKPPTPDDAGVTNAYVVANPGDHAAITNTDGSYIIDDLPAGSYTVGVDPQTVADNLGVVKEPLNPVELQPGAHVEGIDFSLGEKQRDIVFTFKKDAALSTMQVSPAVVPPGAAAQVTVFMKKPASSVSITAFGETTALRKTAFDRWTGELLIPPAAPAGQIDVVAHVGGNASADTSASISVDPAVPLANFVLNPPHPYPGQYVQVRARFLVPVNPGDTIQWQDGTVTVLSKPSLGRIFTFNVKTTVRPYRGQLLTSRGKLPIKI